MYSFQSDMIVFDMATSIYDSQNSFDCMQHEIMQCNATFQIE